MPVKFPAIPDIALFLDELSARFSDPFTQLAVLQEQLDRGRPFLRSRGFRRIPFTPDSMK